MADGRRTDGQRKQHNYGRAYVDSGLAAAHARWCDTFAGVVRTFEEPGPVERAEIQLNAHSDLFACGYRITGLSREERWRVLSGVAVPRLGHQQVIDTIRSLIRLRETQGRDYSHAIGEWEYDLRRLGG